MSKTGGFKYTRPGFGKCTLVHSANFPIHILSILSFIFRRTKNVPKFPALKFIESKVIQNFKIYCLIFLILKLTSPTGNCRAPNRKQSGKFRMVFQHVPFNTQLIENIKGILKLI